MSIRYPAPLGPGDRIAVTSPSAGVGEEMRPRLEFCIDHLRGLGYEVVVGDCMDGSGVISAPAPARAAELTAMLVDPAIGAVVPPWGGELAIDLLPLLDFEAISAAEPTWLVGYSDLTTVMVPLTPGTGIVTLHGSNLMDTPCAVGQLVHAQDHDPATGPSGSGTGRHARSTWSRTSWTATGRPDGSGASANTSGGVSQRDSLAGRSARLAPGPRRRPEQITQPRGSIDLGRSVSVFV